jgi:hypothetical protein
MNPYYFAFSNALSPSGDIVATITYNALDNDMDIVLVSAKDGSILRNITKGYTSRYESIKYEIDPSLGKSLAWSRDGDRIAFFARDGQKHALFIIDALSGKTLRSFRLEVDQPTSPCFYPDGEKMMFAGFQKGTRDIFALDLASGFVANLTQDALYEKAPVISPDGTKVAYSLRVESTDKLFLSPLADFKTKKQLTFGKGNTVTPEFSADGSTIFFGGDMRDAYNIYSLNLNSGEMRRYTDVRTGNFFPAPLPNDPQTVVFSAFNKGAFQLFRSSSDGVVEQTLAFADPGPGEPAGAFKPALSFDLSPDKIKPHTGMGPLYVTERPPVDAIISTDGSIYGGSALAFSDILVDYQFSVMAYQVREFRSFFIGYLNQKNRFQYAINAFQYTLYYYPYQYYYDPAIWNYVRPSDAIATRKISGLSFSAYYPLSKFIRLEGNVGLTSYEEDSLDTSMSGGFGAGRSGYFMNGTMLAATAALTGETTRFKIYGPASGSTFRLSVSQAIPAAAAFIRNTTVDADLRRYVYLGSDFVLAARWKGFMSRGRNPFIGYYGGNNQVRSSYYYSLVATEYWFAAAELRFPLVGTASTILGRVGPVRGVFFFDVTRNKYGSYPAKFYVRISTPSPRPTDSSSNSRPSGRSATASNFFSSAFRSTWNSPNAWSGRASPCPSAPRVLGISRRNSGSGSIFSTFGPLGRRQPGRAY